jgi:hypothetical protein
MAELSCWYTATRFMHYFVMLSLEYIEWGSESKIKSILRFAKPNPLLIILFGSSHEDSESRINPELGQFFFVISYATSRINPELGQFFFVISYAASRINPELGQFFFVISYATANGGGAYLPSLATWFLILKIFFV